MLKRRPDLLLRIRNFGIVTTSQAFLCAWPQSLTLIRCAQMTHALLVPHGYERFETSRLSPGCTNLWFGHAGLHGVLLASPNRNAQRSLDKTSTEQMSTRSYWFMEAPVNLVLRPHATMLMLSEFGERFPGTSKP
jgi:hypothetical protein